MVEIDTVDTNANAQRSVIHGSIVTAPDLYSGHQRSSASGTRHVPEGNRHRKKVS
jgi:hypothetical protein